MNGQNKETAVPNKQQLKTKQKIVNDIIRLLAKNNLTIIDSKEILYETSKAIFKQKVIPPNISSGWIDANDYHSNARN